MSARQGLSRARYEEAAEKTATSKADGSIFVGPRRLRQAELLARAASPHALVDPNRPVLASLLAGHLCGEGVLPTDLGLPATELENLWNAYFPGPRPVPWPVPPNRTVDIPERQDLVSLLLAHRAACFPSETWLAFIVARACAGNDHLWHDLGLANRGELSSLLYNAFPSLARQNTEDMKWKKFIYRFYCARDGIYVCPAPSCGECVDYAQCFAPEI
ncbi:MAG: nitrogen fixation protein NifQ [Azoarcus sp.]|jgi:nitrogen fixation protein NifQ|nr:nitrogen fixation protein NifQ [Azoarcus sp.]